MRAPPKAGFLFFQHIYIKHNYTMKLSQLKQLIYEEVESVLENEFESAQAAQKIRRDSIIKLPPHT